MQSFSEHCRVQSTLMVSTRLGNSKLQMEQRENFVKKLSLGADVADDVEEDDKSYGEVVGIFCHHLCNIASRVSYDNC